MRWCDEPETGIDWAVSSPSSINVRSNGVALLFLPLSLFFSLSVRNLPGRDRLGEAQPAAAASCCTPSHLCRCQRAAESVDNCAPGYLFSFFCAFSPMNRSRTWTPISVRMFFRSSVLPHVRGIREKRRAACSSFPSPFFSLEPFVCVASDRIVRVAFHPDDPEKRRSFPTPPTRNRRETIGSRAGKKRALCHVRSRPPSGEGGSRPP